MDGGSAIAQADLRDPVGFRRIYDDLAPGVFRTALSVLGDRGRAEDVTQDVFLTLWRRPERFDARRGGLGTYLRVVARSRALDAMRTQQAAGRAVDRLREAHGGEASREPTPAEATEVAADRVIVREGLRELPPSQREALLLAYAGSMTTQEVAGEVGVPLGTAKSRLRLGLAKLREEVGDRLEPSLEAA